jgi:YfiH family protein
MSSASTADAVLLREEEVAGTVPRSEIPGWRERFGVVAGITTRGALPGRGFDLGLWSDAPVGEVMNRWRAFRSAEPGLGAVVLGHQVHGSEVAWHDGARGWMQLEGLDGHATAAAGILLAVTVADCIPVYLVDPRRRAVALLHAGWRGTAAGILDRGIELLMERAGTDPGDVVMHAGVGICGTCYEVGSEVMTALGVPAEGSGPWHADLRDRLTANARRLGIGEVTRSAWCSAHDRPTFYSHRASRGADGRMVAYLGLR